MFGFDWSEIILVAVVALVLIGPKDMPVAIRMGTDALKKMRRLAAEMQGHVDEMVREADLGEARDTFRDLRSMNLRGQVLRTIDGDGLLRRSLSETPALDANLVRTARPPGLRGADAAIAAPLPEGAPAAGAASPIERIGRGANRILPEAPGFDAEAPCFLPPGARRAAGPAPPAWIPPGRPRHAPAWDPVRTRAAVFPRPPATGADAAPGGTTDATSGAAPAVAHADGG